VEHPPCIRIHVTSRDACEVVPNFLMELHGVAVLQIQIPSHFNRSQDGKRKHFTEIQMH